MSEHPYNIAVLDLETAKEHAVWGTFGKGGLLHCNGTCPEHPLRYVRLKDCETDHLKAILATQSQIQGRSYQRIILSILADREII